MDEDKFLKIIKQLESSNGANVEHPVVTSGMHKGHQAIGQYGLMPNTVDELIGRTKNKNLSQLKDMSPEDKKTYIEEHPDLEDILAKKLASKVLNNQGGDAEKAAYSWLNGHNLSSEQINDQKLKKSDYVQKFKKLMPLIKSEDKASYIPSEEEQNKIINYMENKPMADEVKTKKQMLEELGKNMTDETAMRNMISGSDKFVDTGREASFTDKLNSMVGGPLRAAIDQGQKGNFNFEGLKNIINQFGKDPNTAPSAIDLAENTGIESPAVKAALASSIDLGENMLTPENTSGVAGSIKTVAANEIAPLFPKLQKMFTVGEHTFPAKNTAQAIQIRDALEKNGTIKKGLTLLGE